MLGPSPAIWLGSRRTARASSASVSRRASPNIRKCSSAGDTRSGGGCVGAGRLTGSYFWYVWMMPPRLSRLAMRLLYAIARSHTRQSAGLRPATRVLANAATNLGDQIAHDLATLIGKPHAQPLVVHRQPAVVEAELV